MKLKFDANQDFQIDAINSIVGLFEGQEKTSNRVVASSGLLGIYPNFLTLSKEDVMSNTKRIQSHNKISNGSSDDYDFSVEMETGTGKTYVYLRTIFELSGVNNVSSKVLGTNNKVNNAKCVMIALRNLRTK
jgi:type III restriction enzyme